MKKNIWFDLGYTLLYLNRESAYQKALKEYGIELSMKEISRGFHFMDKLFMREYRGYFGGPREFYMPWYIGRLNMFLGVKLDITMIFTRWMELRDGQERQWEAYSFCHDTLPELRSEGYSLGVISNWDRSARPILDELGLTAYFDTIIISSEVGIEKPEAGIFLKAFEVSGTTAEDGIYIGDNYYDDAVGSRSVGMECLIVNRFGKFGIEEITDCQIIPDISSLLQIGGSVK
ncbi:MAG: HAD-IA family hydrolase [Spirochaetales bacterium]|nr:HAD-IA family hydrolase [Spirochaetales bacterium]